VLADREATWVNAFRRREASAMVSNVARNFRDPWEHQSFFRAADMKVVVTERGDYSSDLTRIDLHQLWMQRNLTSLPQITHLSDHDYRCPIAFLTDAQQAPIVRNGEEVQPGTIVVSAPRAEYYYRMTAPCRIGFMSLAPSELAAAGRAIAGYDLTAPAETRLIRPPEHLMARLLQLHEAAGHLAATTPDILTHPQVARAFEDELIRAMIGCLTEATTVDSGSRAYMRVPVMQRFERVVGEAEGEPLYVMEICARIGVQVRTLRNYCLEYLGVSPHRYLWLRRMHQVRRALSLANPAEKTVTTIANDFGFWELGRFSVAYRELFGESPSTTLRDTADHVAVAVHSGVRSGPLPILP
jgi:AraC-like DNA-binding protein